jgi:hypothetical protein
MARSKSGTWSIANSGIKWNAYERNINIRNFIDKWQASESAQAGIPWNLSCIYLTNDITS